MVCFSESVKVLENRKLRDVFDIIREEVTEECSKFCSEGLINLDGRNHFETEM